MTCSASSPTGSRAGRQPAVAADAAENPVYWPRFAQAWACLGVLHHKPDEPWPDSTRRAVLVNLVNGVEDWATDAAANALVVAAWTDPACRADVVEIVGARFAAAGQARIKRQVTIADSLAHLVLVTPEMPRNAVSAATALIRHETARVKAIKQDAAAPPPGEPAAASRPKRRLFRPGPDRLTAADGAGMSAPRRRVEIMRSRAGYRIGTVAGDRGSSPREMTGMTTCVR